MPQHQLIRTQPAITGVQIRLEEERSPSKSGFQATVYIARDYGPYMPATSSNYHGLMVDLLTDLAMEVSAAFLFGEVGDIQRASASNLRVARAHARRHQYDSRPF